MLLPQEMNDLLDREYTIPVSVDASGPIPNDNIHYDSIRQVINDGFTFSLGELFHAVGCKTASLPMSNYDQCLWSAGLLINTLDYNGIQLRFRNDLDSDIQTQLSQNVGIGVTSLIATRCWDIDWDQLDSIPGNNKRFDYRGVFNNGSAMFEAKGTKNRGYQRTQISNGLEKKEAHHLRGDRFDVELIVSTCITDENAGPRILIADPEFNVVKEFFNEEANEIFRYRHYSRMMQYIGMPRLARIFYLESLDSYNTLIKRKPVKKPSDEILDYSISKRLESSRLNVFYEDMKNMQILRAGGMTFYGKWTREFVPEKRKSKFKNKFSKIESSYFPTQVEIFQGISEEVVELVHNIDIKKRIMSKSEAKNYRKSSEGLSVSVFSDGTIFAMRLAE